MPRIALLLTIALSISAGAGCAAGVTRPRPLTLGDRARVHAPGSHLGYSTSRTRSLIGTVTAVTPDSFALRVPERSEQLVVPAQFVEQLHVSEGKRSRGRTALIAGGIGLAMGALAGWAADDPSDSEVATGDWIAAGAGVGLVLGAGLGAALGGGERWRGATLPVRTGFAPFAPPTFSLYVTLVTR